jgi:hypothetical protein
MKSIDLYTGHQGSAKNYGQGIQIEDMNNDGFSDIVFPHARVQGGSLLPHSGQTDQQIGIIYEFSN